MTSTKFRPKKRLSGEGIYRSPQKPSHQELVQTSEQRVNEWFEKRMQDPEYLAILAQYDYIVKDK